MDERTGLEPVRELLSSENQYVVVQVVASKGESREQMKLPPDGSEVQQLNPNDTDDVFEMRVHISKRDETGSEVEQPLEEEHLDVQQNEDGSNKKLKEDNKTKTNMHINYEVPVLITEPSPAQNLSALHKDHMYEVVTDFLSTEATKGQMNEGAQPESEIEINMDAKPLSEKDISDMETVSKLAEPVSEMKLPPDGSEVRQLNPSDSDDVFEKRVQMSIRAETGSEVEHPLKKEHLDVQQTEDGSNKKLKEDNKSKTNMHINYKVPVFITEPCPAQDLSAVYEDCLLYTSPSPRDATLSRMPSSA